MGLFRYRAEERTNIAAAQKEGRRNAALEASLAQKKATTSADVVAANLATFQTSTTTALSNKEPTIAAGTAAQYWRGDKSWQAVAINDVTGLSSALSGLSTAAAAKLLIPALSTIATDAAATITPTGTNSIVFHTGTLTANRTITISTSGIAANSIARIVRTGAGAFNLSIGALKNLATSTWCDVVYNGTAWQLTAYGTL